MSDEPGNLGAGDSAADAAVAAAEAVQPEQATGTPGAGPTHATAQASGLTPTIVGPVPSDEGLVNMLETCMKVVIRMQCSRGGVILTPEAMQSMGLQPSERQDLLTYIPYAKPYLGALAANSDKIGMGLFCLTLYTAYSARMATIKAQLAPKESEDE